MTDDKSRAPWWPSGEPLYINREFLESVAAGDCESSCKQTPPHDDCKACTARKLLADDQESQNG